MYTNFYNIDSSNNVFYYNPLQSIVIPVGNYNLLSFNKYLLTTAAALYRVVVSYDGLTYQVASYVNATDRANDVNRTV